MQLRRIVVAAAALLLASACAEYEPTAPAPSLARKSASQRPQRYLVLFNAEGDAPANFAARVKALGGSVAVTTRAGVAVVNGLTPSAAAKLARGSDIAVVEPDVVVQLGPVERTAVRSAVALPAANPDPTTAFAFPFQWHARQIDLDDLWASDHPNKFGSDAVKVAILDSGIDPTHFDLLGRIDTDLSTSFIEDAAREDSIARHYFPTLDRPEWNDLNGHGTHVANTVTSRGFVAAGMTSQATLIAVKVLNVDGSGTFGSIFAGVTYAADVGADVINMSLGVSFPKRVGGGFHSVFNRIMSYARKRGSLVVVAAGNSAIDMDHDGDTYNAFCNTPHVMCVSGTGPSEGDLDDLVTFPPETDFDELAFFSNFGKSAVDLAAPGGNYTLNEEGTAAVSGGFVWQACATTTLFAIPKMDPEDPEEDQLYFPINCTIGSVIGFAGTSQAAPHVSGLAAILIAGMGPNQPDAVKARILETVDDIGPAGHDASFGAGRINAARAAGVN